jgi:hypothetical protein
MASGRTIERVVLVNPLGTTLEHYCAELADSLEPRRVEVSSAWTPTASLSAVGRVAWLLRHLGAVARVVRTFDLAIICWPLLGAVDVVWAAAVSWGLRSEIWIIVHDPVPLRRQVGLGKVAWRAAGIAARLAPRVRVISHSAAATGAMAAVPSERILELPHPVLAQRPSVRARSDRHLVVTVLGQHKTARDLTVLEGIGALAPQGLPGVSLRIRGRGWPLVRGWDVDPMFLDEEQFAKNLSASDVIVVPYARYFQSNVAVRALEAGVGVVIPRSDFAEALLGPSYPGLCTSMEATEWIEAIRAVSTPGERAAQLERREHYGRIARQQWRAAIDGLSISGGRS